jgi:hypothetical protein
MMGCDDFRGSRQIEADLRTGRWRVVGRPRFPVVNRRLLVLLALGCVLIPWLPASGWNSAPMQTAHGRSDELTARFAFSPGGETFATVHTNGHVALWDVTCGWRITRTIDHSGCARAVAFSPDGHWLAVGATQPGISLYDRGSCDVEPSFGIPFDAVWAMAFSPDSRILAAASSSHREVLLWDLAAGRERVRLRGHGSPVFSLAMAPDGRSLATAGREDGRIIIWNLDAQRARFRLEVPKAPVTALVYSPDGTMLTSVAGSPLPVRIWDTRSGRLLWHVGAHSAAASANAVAFSRDGRLLAVAGCEGGLGLWSADTGRNVGCVKVPGDRLCGVGFSPDGSTLVATGFDNDVRIWRVEDLARAESESTP